MKKKRNQKAINTEKQDKSVTTTDKLNIPKASWNEEENVLKVSTACPEDWIKSMGAVNMDMANMLLSQIVNPNRFSQQANKIFIDGTIAMYRSIKPQDTIESLLATQMVAIHNMAMECLRRSMLSEQTVEGVDTNINHATKLTRTFAAQVETLKRYRTGGKQTIQVQHINVSEGGQAAIVGNVQGGGGDG